MLVEEKCHICSGSLVENKAYQSLFQVTSDCRPWKSGGRVAVCQNCSVIQKPDTIEFRQTVEDIYSGYNIYFQANGEEQITFDSSKGDGVSRSHKIISWIQANLSIGEKGDILDIGCGNGAFLKAFNSVYQKWKMYGFELDNKNQAQIESIPGVEQLFYGKIEDIERQFNVISLIHSLEHIPNAVGFLQMLSSYLKEDGVILVQLPNIEISPFELVIADHYTHFTEDSLKLVFEMANYEVIASNSDFVPKEISLLAKQSNCENSKSKRVLNSLNSQDRFQHSYGLVESHIDWLSRLIDQGLSMKQDVGVFGTSNAASWLAGILEKHVSFFVDEDINRIGSSFLGVPVLNPTDAPKDIPILIPLRNDIAKSIATRHKPYKLNYILPPF